MKKICLLLSFFVLTTSVWSQKNYTRSDIFTAEKLTWFGLDFSGLKCIDPTGFTNPEAIVNTYFRTMNELFQTEPDKYDLKKFLDKKEVKFDLEPVTKLNESVNPGDLVLAAGSSYSIPQEDLAGMIGKYSPAATEGIGLVFIMEKFDKASETGAIWVTFFDIASKNVLLADRLTEKAAGFGFRNYWVKTAYNALEEIQKKKMKAWQK